MDDRDHSLALLQHALGLNEFGQGVQFRNHFVTGKGGAEWDMWMAHVHAGRAVRHEPREIFGGPDSYCFSVTEAGKAYVREQSPKPPKLTRSQRTYQRYLDCDSSMKFGEWLKRHPAAKEAIGA